MDNENKIILEFETEMQKNEFISWFLDGGGDQDFYSESVEYREAIPPFSTSIEKKADDVNPTIHIFTSRTKL